VVVTVEYVIVLRVRARID